jgi:hypothetical protein
MSHRHDLRDRWGWEESRERETPDVEREAEAPFERDVGDPRWGTGGMPGNERASRAAPHDVNERAWPDAFRRGVVVRTYQPHIVEWEPLPRPELPPDPYPSTPGPYVGRGPRGYRRSDERIREDVCERFTAHGELDPTDVEVSVRGGEVRLSGTVSTRAQKRLAEDIVDAVFGVAEVHNHLRVRPLLVDPRPQAAAPADRRMYENSVADHHR